jgi:hypothetical protein
LPWRVLLCCGPLEVIREAVELTFPELPISLDPARRFTHWRRDEDGSPHSSLAPDTREARSLEHPYVLRCRRERHVEAGRELADRLLAGCESGEDLATYRMCEGREGGVEVGGMVNHVV